MSAEPGAAKSHTGAPASKRLADVAASNPPPKRSRVSRACDQCRTSREKCDGTQPICHTCFSQSRDCTYNQQPKKRGIQPHYIRTLELAIAWIFQELPDVETRLECALFDAKDMAAKLITGKDEAASEVLHQGWRDSSVCRHIDQLLSGVAPLPSAVRLHRSATVQQNMGRPASNSLSSADCVRQLPEDGWALLEHYLAFTHTWLPIVDKSAILKLMYAYPVERGGESAELWSIMALARLQASPEDERSEHYYAIATSLMPNAREPFTLGHVRSLLLLTVFDMTQARWLPAWLLIGTAVRLMIFIRNSSDPAISDERFQHILLAAFILEATISQYCGIPPHMHTRMVLDVSVAEDGMDEWAPWHNPMTGPSGGRTPMHCHSTLNALVSALRSQHLSVHGTKHTHEAGYTGAYMTGRPGKASNIPSTGRTEIVMNLVRNAAANGAHVHPSVIVAQYQHSTTSDAFSPLTITEDILHVPSHVMLPDNGALKQTELIKDPAPVAYMSIPNGLYSDQVSPVNMASAHSYAWSPTQAGQSTTGAGQEGPSTGFHDMFEEFATLERTESVSNAQFMQNLGFGPDGDLAEFFGADYDPLLSYEQPNDGLG